MSSTDSMISASSCERILPGDIPSPVRTNSMVVSSATSPAVAEDNDNVNKQIELDEIRVLDEQPA
ncbi:MAG: hypothetical protein HC910_17890 [Spirulinaceae cyanobacterium SM2_1_0]|nr:hypothetical protein [Spirulinaceae cyanobacterium SM2_1_0]